MFLQQSACAVDLRSVTPARFVLPGSVALVTAQSVCRLFRFVPNRRVVQMIDFCLRGVATDFEGEIKLHEFLFMSNHFHLLLTDVAGVLPAFMGKLNSLISSNLNAMRGTTGRNFEGYSVQLLDPDDLERQVEAAVYTLNNAASAHLVTRCKHWKATSSFGLEYGEASFSAKPAFGIWASKLDHLSRRESRRSGRAAYGGRSKYPSRASLTLHPLPGQPLNEGDVDEQRTLRQRVKDTLERAEDDLIELRRAEGIRVVGWRKVQSAHFNTMPAQGRELFGTNPTFACSTEERREAARVRMEAFYAAYQDALKKFNAGQRNVEFPRGTWLMVQRHNVRLAPPDT